LRYINEYNIKDIICVILSPEEFVYCEEPEDFSKNSSEAKRLGYGCTRVTIPSENLPLMP
jgi:hypothetical protein